MGLVLITIDSLRLDDMAHIDLPDAQVFPCVSSAPITSVACASILTGLYPPRHGLRNLTGFSLNADVTTLAEIFKAAGYATHAVVSGPPLKRFSGLGRGFDIYDDEFSGFKRSCVDVFGIPIDLSQDKLFLWLHLFDLHPPFSVDGPSLKHVFDARRRILGELSARIVELADAFPRHRFIVTSDHGETFFLRAKPTMWIGHGERLDDVDVNVPLFLCRFGECWKPWAVRQVDIVPTVCREFDLPIPPDIDGVAIQAQTEELWAYSESYLKPCRNFPNLRSVRRGLDLLVCGDNAMSFRCPGARRGSQASQQRLHEMRDLLSSIGGPLPLSETGDGLTPEEREQTEDQLKKLGYL